MKYRTVGILGFIYLAILFLLSVGWEYLFEDIVNPHLIADYQPEDALERWEFIITATILSAVAMILPGILLVKNIAARRRTEEYYERLNSILQATPDIIIISRRSGVPIFMNRAARTTFGITNEEDIPKFRFIDSHSAQSRKTVLDVGIPTALEKGLWVGESELIDGQGRCIPVSEVILASRGADGKIEYLSGICRDITPHKEVERLKSDLIGIVSHELRTPLTSIQSAISMLGREIAPDLPSDAAEMLQIAESNTRRLVRLVNDILDLEKIDNDRLELITERIDFRTLVTETLLDMTPMASESEVRLIHEIDEQLVVEGDKDRLAQVITNLVGNAIKFSRRGGTITVRAKNEADGQVRLSVEDQGPGIDERNISRLFDKFQQFGDPPKGGKQGSGLGLAISKAIIDQHGGKIGVDTEMGRGSTFYFILPRFPEQPS
ncbi:MAG: PAS domain S-box protein [SAR324 cluster bacterium]|nr:PAS domain S-box protein [SAR324 cluster bacterium]